MDRLSALAIVLLVGACDDTPKTGAPTSRTEGARGAVQKGATTEAFCDVHYAANKAPPFAWPPKLVPPETAAKSWQWINVWATWCKPCVEEMPLLVRSRGKLGAPVSLAFVSIDENDADVAAFKQEHPDTPATARLPDAAARAAWFHTFGLDGEPPIPVHIFVDPAGRVRCARAGSVREGDLPVIQKLFSE